MQKGKVVVRGGLRNGYEKKRSERQRRKPTECRVPKNSKESNKAFLSDQCKEIEENNRMGKTRDLFKEIRDAKGIFNAKMGSIKDKNDIKKRGQEYTQELYKKDLHDSDNHDGMITHLDSDVLECEVKGALGSITTNKASEMMEFQLSYFKS